MKNARQTPRYDVTLMRRHQWARGWNDSQLAAAAGVSQPTIGRFFTGTHRTPGTAAAIARALGHSVEHYLLGRSKVSA